ncbi:MAG: DUF554 domain-containing protein [Anaerolineaceae bacterium]|nr:DUF554 domain-containing protein [Anaerolineaceae bacterium]
MTGTLINVIAVLVGGFIGLFFGAKIPEKFRQTLIHALGLFTLCYGIFIFTKTQNVLIPLGSMVIGTILGEWWQLEEGMEGIGEKLRARFAGGRREGAGPEADAKEQRRFVDGFVSASLLFCIGPMTILGSIQDGLTGNYEMLAVKSLLDCIAAIAFAATLGSGVLFSSVFVLVFQGGISMAAKLAGTGFSEAAISEMSSVGGVVLAGIAISSLLALRKIRTGSFLPALLVAVIAVYLLNALGISY